VGELDAGELALPQPKTEQQQQRHPVTLARLRGDQLAHVARGERSAGDLAFTWTDDRQRRVSAQLRLANGPGEEVAQDADHLAPGPCGAFAPAAVDELAEPLRPHRRLEVADF
jgi:hypothetical protein